MNIKRIKWTVNKETIYMYNQMIKYYHSNMGKRSQYGNVVITERLLFNIMKRRAMLTSESSQLWVK